MFYGLSLTTTDLGSDGSGADNSSSPGEGTPCALIIVPVRPYRRALERPPKAAEMSGVVVVKRLKSRRH
jgi:hypothetical protein